MNKETLYDTAKDVPLISEWIKAHTSSKYVDFSFIKDSTDFSVQKSKYIQQLTDCAQRLKGMKAQIVENLTKIADSPFVKVGAFCFDNPVDNCNLRKIVFLKRKIQKTNLKLNNLIINVYIEKVDDCENIIKILNKLPSNISCKITDSFFMVNLSEKIQSLSFRLLALENYCKNLDEEMRVKPRPVWYTDFVGFMHDMLSKSVPHVDEELGYVPPLTFELQVSRYCFSIGSEVGERIDELIQLIFDVPPVDFLKMVLDTSLALLPEANTFTDEEQTVALLVFFRIIFDRLYELYPDFMFPSDGKEYIKMSALASLPCSVFNLPKEGSPNYGKGESIRDAFRNDCYYRSASLFLENTSYSTNPIDSLFFIHKTLTSINKAALMNRMKEKEASITDLQQLLCFDDLFILFLGVYLASDTYEFLSVADFVTRFSPAFCLSNSFEYAQASLESLVKHLESMDPEKLRKNLE